MNWIGGARKRLKIKDERKRQRDFFAKQKLKKQIEGIQSSRKDSHSFSLDLLSLQAANYTASQYSHNDSFGKTPKRKNVINLEKSNMNMHSLRHYEDLGLSLSPPSVPSTLQLEEVNTRPSHDAFLRNPSLKGKPEIKEMFAKQRHVRQIKRAHSPKENYQPSSLDLMSRKAATFTANHYSDHGQRKWIHTREDRISVDDSCSYEYSLQHCQDLGLTSPQTGCSSAFQQREGHISSHNHPLLIEHEHTMHIVENPFLKGRPKIKSFNDDQLVPPMPLHSVIELDEETSPIMKSRKMQELPTFLCNDEPSQIDVPLMRPRSATYESTDTAPSYSTPMWGSSSDVFFQFPLERRVSASSYHAGQSSPPSSTEMSCDSSPTLQAEVVDQHQSLKCGSGEGFTCGSTMGNFKRYFRQAVVSSSPSLSSRDLLCSEEGDFTSPEGQQQAVMSRKVNMPPASQSFSSSDTKKLSQLSRDYNKHGSACNDSRSRQFSMVGPESDTHDTIAEKVLKEVLELDKQLNQQPEDNSDKKKNTVFAMKRLSPNVQSFEKFEEEENHDNLYSYRGTQGTETEYSDGYTLPSSKHHPQRKSQPTLNQTGNSYPETDLSENIKAANDEVMNDSRDDNLPRGIRQMTNIMRNDMSCSSDGRSISETQQKNMPPDTNVTAARTAPQRKISLSNGGSSPESMTSSLEKIHMDNVYCKYHAKFQCCDCVAAPRQTSIQYSNQCVQTDTAMIICNQVTQTDAIRDICNRFTQTNAMKDICDQFNQTDALHKHTNDTFTQTENKSPKFAINKSADDAKGFQSVCAQTDHISLESQSIQTDVIFSQRLNKWSEIDANGPHMGDHYTEAVNDMSVCISQCEQRPVISKKSNECVSDSDTLGESLDSFQSLSPCNNEI